MLDPVVDAESGFVVAGGAEKSDMSNDPKGVTCSEVLRVYMGL
jgi:hypothetical protein